MGIDCKIEKQLGNFCLDVAFSGKGKRIGILGASGCGKSMTLKCIAGIEEPDQGFVRIAGKVLYDSEHKINLKTQKRKVGYLFQNYALFPTMTVRENIGAGIRNGKKEKAEIIENLMNKFQISELGDRLPGELSGGQQQRAALARIMASEPEVILLDEPFSALDLFLKEQMQEEMKRLLQDFSGTVILVSHSRDEIYRFCEDLLILDGGRIICQGDTKEIFANPGYMEAARLTGCKNITKAVWKDENTIVLPEWKLELENMKSQREDNGLEINYVGVRAHDFKPVWTAESAEKELPAGCIPVTVESVAELPFEKDFFLRSPDGSGKTICWFVQRELWPVIEERGMPQFLKIPVEKLLMLH